MNSQKINRVIRESIRRAVKRELRRELSRMRIIVGTAHDEELIDDIEESRDTEPNLIRDPTDSWSDENS